MSDAMSTRNLTTVPKQRGPDSYRERAILERIRSRPYQQDETYPNKDRS